MPGEVLFRNSFNGFNKKDVYTYITSQNEKVRSMLSEKSNEIADLEKKLQDTETEFNEYKEKSQKQLEKYTEESKPSIDFLSKIAQMREISENLKSAIESQRENYNKVCSSFVDKSIAYEKASKYKEKAEKYDMLTRLLNNTPEKDPNEEAEVDVKTFFETNGMGELAHADSLTESEYDSSNLVNTLIDELKRIEEALNVIRG